MHDPPKKYTYMYLLCTQIMSICTEYQMVPSHESQADIGIRSRMLQQVCADGHTLRTSEYVQGISSCISLRHALRKCGNATEKGNAPSLQIASSEWKRNSWCACRVVPKLPNRAKSKKIQVVMSQGRTGQKITRTVPENYSHYFLTIRKRREEKRWPREK